MSKHFRRKKKNLTSLSSKKVNQGSWLRFLRYWYLRLLRLQGTPQAIARGLACGVFAGFFPAFGIQTIAAVIIANWFRANTIAAAVGTYVSNPFTDVPILAFNYKVGAMLLGANQMAFTNITNNIGLKSWSELLDLGAAIFKVLFVGCFAVGLVGGIITYFLSLPFIRRWYHARKSRRLARYNRG
jgi:uncharacterized protein